MKDVLLTSSVLILAVVLLRFLFRRTVSRRVQYALWLLVLLRLLIPLSLPAMKLSVLTAAEPVKETRTWETASEVYRLPVPRMSYTRAYEQVTEEARTAGEDLSAYSDSELEDRAYTRMMSGLTVRDALHLIWYVGMGFTALLLLLVNLRFARRLRRTRVPLEGTGSKYPVYLCDDIPSPCLFGLCKPAIYVTSPAARDPDTLRYVLAHEETHARHLDPLWSLLRSLCLAVWWFDPLVWLAAHLSRLDGELACDEGALARLGENERIPYGETLLRLIPLGRGGSPMLTATTMTAGKRQMKDRIRRIAEHKKPLVVALVVVLVLAAAVCAVTFTGTKKRPGEQAPSPEPTGQVQTPVPTAPRLSSVPAGTPVYADPEAYLEELRVQKTSLSYPSAQGGEAVARVLDTRVAYLEKQGELPKLAPEGSLELYTYLIEVKPDAEPEDIALVGGMTVTEDGWYDLEGQGGHALVLLRYADGSVSVLHDRPNNDDMGGLYYYEETAEEMLWDWYVREYGLDLPTYTVNLLLRDKADNCPARRHDGDGWYIYIPIAAWEQREGEDKWVSRYRTGSSIIVRETTEEYMMDAGREKTARGQEERYMEGKDGRLWLVLTQFDPESITNTPEIRDEPRVLEAMLESFTLPGGREVLRRTWLHTVPPTLAERMEEAADRIFGAYDAPGTGYRIAVAAEGERHEYAISRDYVPRGDSLSTGKWLQNAYFWTPLTEEEIAAVDRDPGHGPVITAWNGTDRFMVYALSDVLCWTELRDGAEHWLRPSGNAQSLYAFFLADARRAEMDRPLTDITVPGTVTDYGEVARQMAEQYGAILMDFPAWYGVSPYDLAVLSAEVFDAYYGEDCPNFCFAMIFALKLDEGNRDYFEPGAGLGDPIADGPYAGWYRWGGEVPVTLEDGLWRFGGLNTGGSAVWLPYGLGWASRYEQLTTEQLVSLYFLTEGNTHYWNLLNYLSGKPVEEVRGEMEKLSDEQRRELLEGMEGYNAAYGKWYDPFDLEAYR